jgi:DNA-binding transcriptional LysR family regulator
MNLAAVDLNLLNAFDALIAERNVSRAATRIGVTQPAMSNALSRLRALFGDELFVRSPQEMRPTPRALELAVPIGEALQNLRFALARPQQDFAPETSTRLFTIAASDNCDFALAPAIGKLRKRAPNIGFDIIGSARAAALDRIDEGMFDIALGRLDHIPQRYFSVALYEERCVFVYNRDVYNFANGLSIEDFAASPHLHVVRDTTDFVDAALAEEGLARRRVMTVPYFALVPYLLEQSDLIAVVGARIAQRFAALPWIGIHELPMGCEPWTISAVWGKAQDADRGVAWLRDQLQQAGAALEAKPS